jgi:hypothetical protein
MPFLVDEHIALGVRKTEELLQDGVDLVNVVLVEDKALLSNVVTIGNNGPPPVLGGKLALIS